MEAGISFGWSEYFNIPQLKVTIDSYVTSGPYKELEVKYGFTGKRIAKNTEELLAKI